MEVRACLGLQEPLARSPMVRTVSRRSSEPQGAIPKVTALFVLEVSCITAFYWIPRCLSRKVLSVLSTLTGQVEVIFYITYSVALFSNWGCWELNPGSSTCQAAPLALSHRPFILFNNGKGGSLSKEQDPDRAKMNTTEFFKRQKIVFSTF